MNKSVFIMKIVLTVVLFTALVMVFAACGETETVLTPGEGQVSTDGLSYVATTNSSGVQEARISNYTGTSPVVTVASLAGGYKVTSLSDTAFQNNTNITGVSLPATVTHIPAAAFKGCTALISISAPGVETVGAEAFYGTAWYDAKPDGNTIWFNGCLYDYKGSETQIAALTQLTLNTDATSITPGLMSKLSSVNEVNMPDTMKHVDGTFDNINTIRKLTVTETSAAIKRVQSKSDVLYSADGQTLIKYPEGKRNVSIYTVPADVKTIKSNAFLNSTISGLSFEGVIDTIEPTAFKGAASLYSFNYGAGKGFKVLGDGALQGTRITNFTFPQTVTEIGADMFFNTSIESVNFGTGGNLTKIGARAFKSQGSFFGTDKRTAALVIPDSVTEIGDEAFYNCEKLKSVNLGQGLISLGGAAFYNIKGITSLTLSPALKELGGSAFYACQGLTSLVLPLSLEEIGNSAFKDCTAITAVYYGSATASAPRESKLSSLGASAFEGCSAISAFIAPHTLTSIGASAFKNCANLSDFYLSRSVGSGITACAQYVFDGINGLKIVVPQDSYAAYQTAPGWIAVAASLNIAPFSANEMIVFFDTGEMGLLMELTGTSTIVLTEEYCNIVIEDEISESSTETISGNSRTVVTTTTTKEFVLEGWYLSKTITDGVAVYADPIAFNSSGEYIFTVVPESYRTVYAKWSTKSTTVSTTEVYES